MTANEQNERAECPFCSDENEFQEKHWAENCIIISECADKDRWEKPLPQDPDSDEDDRRKKGESKR